MRRESGFSGGGRTLRVGLCSLGCAKNQIDAEVMLGRLKEAGFEICSEGSEADVILVNTCAFIDEAKAESIETIIEMARHKRTGRCRRLLVTGCLSQRYKAELLKEVPEIDACLGLDESARIVEAVSGAYQPHPSAPLSRPVRLDTAADPRLPTTRPHTKYIKVSDGCDHRCAFCVIPSIRGRYRSRPINDIRAEAENLIRAGAVELSLVAQDLGPYGDDIGLEHGLPKLLRALASIESLRWLRLLYVYPEGISDELIETIAGESKVVPYLDIPLQHASQRVLAAMRRPGGAEEHLELIERLRREIAGLAIRTSLVAGFPSEEEEDFEELEQFLREARLDHVGVFTYSHEEGTAAFGLYEDMWSSKIKRERQKRIMELQQVISLEKNFALLGSRRECLIDGPHPETDLLLAGRLSTQAPEIDGCVVINEGFAAPGQLVTIEITEAHHYDLVGRIVDE